MKKELKKREISNVIDYLSSEGVKITLITNEGFENFNSSIEIIDHDEKLHKIIESNKISKNLIISSNIPSSLKNKTFTVELNPNKKISNSFKVKNLEEIINIFKEIKNTLVIVPAYNEQKTLKKVLNDLKVYFNDDQIILIDDGSHDNTREIAKSMNVETISHIINRGLGGALSTGIEFAVHKGALNIVTFDADGQHKVEDIRKLLYPLINNDASFVIGSRFKGDTSNMPLIKVIGNKILNYITFMMTGKLVSDSQSGLRGIKREMAKDIDLKCDKYAISSEFIMESKGFKLKEIPIKAIYDDYSANKGTNVMSGIKIFLKLVYKILTEI